MADNTLLNPGIGGDLIATDDIAGVKYQWVKNAFGADGAVVPVAAAAGSALPVALMPPQAAISQTLAAPNDTMVIPCDGCAVVALAFNGAYTGTLQFSVSVDGGVNYFNVAMSGQNSSSLSANTTSSTSFVGWVPCSGCTHVRVVATALSAGSVTITARGSANGSQVNFSRMTIDSIAANVFPGGAASALGKVEDAPHTSGDTGVFALGVRNDNDATFTSTDLDYSPVNVDSSGRVRVMLRTTSSVSGNRHRLASANTTNPTSVKVGQANLYTIFAANVNAAVRYLKFYDKASAPTVGTDTPAITVPIPPTPNGPIVLHMPLPYASLLGLAYATTTGAPDADTGAVAANEIFLSLMYA